MGKAEKGEITLYLSLYWKVPSSAPLNSFVTKEGIISSAWLRSKAISSDWETIGRLGEVILMLTKIVYDS